MSKFRVGIVGSGFGGTVHAPAFAAHPAFELVAIASPNRAEGIARERKIPHAFASIEAMLDGVELDVVAVAPPPFAHAPATLAALARGKHVLCEKPLALSVEEGVVMLEAARRAGTACGVAFEFRFTAPRQAVHELIVNRHLGALREIEITQLERFLRASVKDRARGWWFEHARGGGIAQAIGSHLIDTAQWLAGRPPLRVQGFCRTAVPVREDANGTFASDVADGMFAVLDFGEGLVARISLDGATALRNATLAVHGDQRTAVATGETLLLESMFTVDEEETSELQLAASPYAKFAAAHPNLPPFLSLLDQFAAAIEGKPNTLPTFEDGLVVQRVLAELGY